MCPGPCVALFFQENKCINNKLNFHFKIFQHCDAVLFLSIVFQPTFVKYVLVSLYQRKYFLYSFLMLL